MLVIGLGVSASDRPPVFAGLLSGSLFQPLTRLACRVSWSLALKLARTPVCTSGIEKNRNDREYSQLALASMTSAPAVVLNLPKSNVIWPRERVANACWMMIGA